MRAPNQMSSIFKVARVFSRLYRVSGGRKLVADLGSTLASWGHQAWPIMSGSRRPRLHSGPTTPRHRHPQARALPGTHAPPHLCCPPSRTQPSAGCPAATGSCQQTAPCGRCPSPSPSRRPQSSRAAPKKSPRPLHPRRGCGAVTRAATLSYDESNTGALGTSLM